MEQVNLWPWRQARLRRRVRCLLLLTLVPLLLALALIATPAVYWRHQRLTLEIRLAETNLPLEVAQAEPTARAVALAIFPCSGLAAGGGGMTSPAAGTGRDRPAIKWLAGYALVAAVVIFAGGVWVVLPEKRRLEQVQRQFIAQRSPPRAESRGLCPSSSAQSGEPGRRLSAGGAAILPPPTGDITGAAPAVESNSHRPADAADAGGQRRCQRLAQDPLSLFMTPGHDPPAGLRWRAMSAGDHGDRPGWTVAATTDFAGVERLLSAIAALNGCIGLQALSLKATPEGLMLDFRLTRADESTSAVAKENDDGEMPAGAY